MTPPDMTDEQINKIVDDCTTDDQGYDIWCNGKQVADAIIAARDKQWAEMLKQVIQDAERYRWLKDSSGKEWDEQYFCAFMIGQLDRAIDANKAAEEKP